ncbi:IPT/TIG domain-containing protein [Flagellimonas sp. HMM57]|uniref:IPT/TIG domain-containing protein n=1 Tax=unclassified Flagellimonas TaxID=2644544 RepID=UPI0013CFFF52|nr:MULTISPECIES: IPT/TIG domain-containing protein [unclassified Flagellimonas]UII74825.1 IPT/TIG domain-containing protein [Flagellimonas sp. HMM57]
MKTLIRLSSLLLLLIAFVGCSDDDENPSAEFTVTAISLESGAVGTEITITGTNFPSNTSDINLTFGGANATITSVTSTQIVTTVPSGATTGSVTVVVDGVTKNVTTDFTVLSDLVSARAENIFAPQTGGQGTQEEASGPFTKFSFATGAVTDSDTEWDIAFRGLTIIVNGGTTTGTNDEPERNGNSGAAIEEGIFSEITDTSGIEFAQDANGELAIPTGSNNGWYNYNFMTTTVTPIPGKILVFRTHDGKFAKIEILSYYKDAPSDITEEIANNDFRYYTFNYVYNPNEGETSLAN